MKAPLRHCARLGCLAEVPAYLLCCRRHWREIPSHLQRALLDTYRPGQWRTGDVSPAYMAALESILEWWLDQDRVLAHA